MCHVFLNRGSYKTGRYSVSTAIVALSLLVLSGCVTSVTTTSSLGGAATGVSQSADSQKAAQTRLELAAEYLRAGNVTVALEEVNNALKLNSSMTEAYVLRGMIYSQRGDFASAEADYARVMRERGSDPDVMHNYGWILCQQGRYADGDVYFDKVLATPGYATSARTWMTKGLCLQAADKTNAAKQALLKAVEYDPNNPIATYNLASMLYHAGQVADAQIYVRRLNNSPYANAETLWLGVKIENAMGNQLGIRELGEVLSRKFPQSREFVLYERKAFYE
ncbi:type IV pilus biogenesis/stability protein PilW [Lampropedia puyangensis]|uniref:Type IV pilus biogenesis/stability protein PilW n=1 Tax=Lampropedia puyangensis TaxID=1330072 RepID=A0A4S8F3K3_9BURK|nr:type IV pilus biogenesis/stability protein PilW [Lampropedia puyangensis]THU01960.1 type IV pilus biogenesis/stability protein PilW [Lampropedia puyangensis]